MNGRTFKVICDKRKVATSMLVSSDSQPDSVLTSNNERNCLTITLIKMYMKPQFNYLSFYNDRLF